jgi:hypothetical protein
MNQTIRTFNFEKEKTGRWYIVLPEWTGAKSELEMVQGADKMLDYVGEGANEITLALNEQPFFGATPLTLYDDNLPVGGGMYLLNKYEGVELNQQLWLCEVTTHVFGRLPEVIYFKRGN